MLLLQFQIKGLSIFVEQIKNKIYGEERISGQDNGGTN